MANIYIRLPISRCQYFRNRDPHHALEPNEPIKFSEYSEPHYILRSSIYNKALGQHIDNRFFSQQEWKNMMRGKDPLGKEMKIRRLPDEWLTYEEIVKIMGEKPNDKTSLFDYLCIRLPTEVYCIDNVRAVSPSWSIDKAGYNKLATLIDNDFKRSVLEWALSTFDYCTSNGRVILRAQQAMLERYLIRYNIEPTEVEKDSLRRVISRWLHQEHCNFSSYTDFDMQYVDSKEDIIPIDDVEWS